MRLQPIVVAEARARRGGYTVIEVVVATALTALVLTQSVGALISSQRMLEAILADVELSLQTRALREKLLYNVNEDGGLMGACKSELAFLNENKGWGDGIEFKPKKGPKNRIVLGGDKRLKADKGKPKWLECGTMVFADTKVFGNSVTTGMIRVNLTMRMDVGARAYVQHHQADTQIMNQ